MLAAAILGSAALGAYGAKKSADANVDAAKTATDLQKAIFKKTTKHMKPFRKAGIKALNPLLYELGLAKKPEGYEGYMESPMAKYALEQGVDRIEGSAAAAGGLASGATLEALENKRYDVVNADRGQYLDRLTGIAGSGQNAAAQLGSFGANYGANAGNTIINAGQARADGITDTTNAITGGIGDFAQWYGYKNPMEQYSRGYSGGAPAYSGWTA